MRDLIAAGTGTVGDGPSPGRVARPRRRRFVAAALGVAVVVAGVSVPGRVQAAETASCPDVVLIGAGGSGQTPGLGKQVQAVVSAIGAQLAAAGKLSRVDAVGYPAVDVARTLGLALFDGRYDRSVAAGARAVVELVATATASCADAFVVLVGYSQGSNAIKLSLPLLPQEAAIAGVVLLADPTRTPDQERILRLGRGEGRGRSLLGDLEVPEHLVNVTIDVCAHGDPVCSGRWSRFGAHLDGYEASARTVAGIVSSRIMARVQFAGWL